MSVSDQTVDLTQDEVDVLTCNLCDKAADLVSECPSYNGHFVSLCADCIREMHDSLTPRH